MRDITEITEKLFSAVIDGNKEQTETLSWTMNLPKQTTKILTDACTKIGRLPDSERLEKSLKEEEEKNRILETENENLRQDFEKECSRLKAENEDLEKFLNEIMSEEEDRGKMLSKIKKLEAENDSLKQSLNERKSHPLGMTDPIIFPGKEEQFFEDEFREVVLDALRKNLESVHEGRRKDILKSILDATPDAEEIKYRSATLKEFMKRYEGADPAFDLLLKPLGIKASTNGKHYKLTYYGDPRYFTTVSATPSDKRAALNAYSQMARTFY